MADPILHIKDSYYFEVPKFLARSDFAGKFFPEFWVRLDDDFQAWEAERLYDELETLVVTGDGYPLPGHDELMADYEHWKHDHANHGKPFDVYLEEHAAQLVNEFNTWRQDPVNQGEELEVFLVQGHPKFEKFDWLAMRLADREWSAKWAEAKERAGGSEAVTKYKTDSTLKPWSAEKVEGYNQALSGKILIPQLKVFGTQKNLYEMESGFGISKFMLLELVVAVVVAAVFIWLARRVGASDRPQGRAWNLLEAILVFIRDQIARPAIDSHDHAEGHDDHGHAAEHGHGHGEKAHAHHKEVVHDGDKFVPYLWTVFVFILGCNLMGIVPWAGTPTASFSVTLVLAGMTFLVGLIFGSKKFGIVGYWKNQVPHMDLPIVLALFLIPMIFLIEVMGLFIKHGVLGIRLLANMVAGHLVLLALMSLTFSVQGVSEMGGVWPYASVAVVLGATAFSCLELFVAFLQAYVFTFLSALFIGAAMHKH